MDLVGHRYGLLTVLERVGKSAGKSPEVLWRCACACGETTVVRQNNLRSGHTKSCGCEMRAATAAINKTHGRSHSKPYIAWRNMRSRCHNPNDKAFSNYGGRGIKVCESWTSSFEQFLSDMGDPPTPKHSIERLDVNKDYCPENCVWATSKEQTRNYRRNVFIEYLGKRQCLADWAQEVGIKRATLRVRLKAGWTVADALSIPVSLSNKPWTRCK